LTPGHAEDAKKPGVPVDSTRAWAILANGRVKPLITFANEMVLSITGRESVKGMSALEILWGYALDSARFKNEALIRVDSPALKKNLGLDESQRRYSFNTLMANPNFQALIQQASQRQQDEIELTRLEKDTLETFYKVRQVANLIRQDSLEIVPIKNSQTGAWMSVMALHNSQDPAQMALALQFDALAKAYQEGDAATFEKVAGEIGTALRNIDPAEYPSKSKIDRELFYEDFNAFGKAWACYLIGFLVLLAMGAYEKRWIYAVGMGFLLAGFACHTLGLGLRWIISERAPVSNMYESLTFMGWGVVAFGIVQELLFHNRRVFALAGALMGFLCLLFAENLPIDPAINPLVPVLAHTYWLSVHVMTIMLSYSAMTLAMALGHFALFLQLYRPGKTEQIRSLALLLYNTIQVGLLFLAAGIIFGAVWANESWGRYWGWDPKETWSLITFFVYLAIIHARFAGWINEFGLAACSVIGFLSVIMTYYGVNFVLGAGLHSYGFSEGGQYYAGAYVVIELAIMLFAFSRYKKASPTQKV